VDPHRSSAGSPSDDPHVAPRRRAAEAPDQRFAASLSAVGGRLRDVRKSAGLSLRELALRSGLSASFLSLVERGECSLSLTSLFAIAAAMDIDPTAVLDSGMAQPAPPEPCGLWRGVEQASTHTTIGEREYFPFTPPLPEQRMAPIYVRIQPTSVVAPLASHSGEEVAYVRVGELYIRLADQELVLRAGDGIHFSSQTPHTIANKTADPVEALWITAADPGPTA
jgi:transcriptional regulator with XRE-family HTH domain